eukprot:Rhum_TRINITY_DN23083_c0_g1::Rhum_TRINITY_DN23083_c0_g1_i1::g.177099::m.177099
MVQSRSGGDAGDTDVKERIAALLRRLGAEGVGEREAQEVAAEVRRLALDRPDEDAVRRQLVEALRGVRASEKRKGMAFREELRTLRSERDAEGGGRGGDPGAKAQDDVAIVSRAARRLNAACDQQNTSLELLSSADEALHAVLRQYTDVRSTLAVTGRFIDALANKADRDRLAFKAAGVYFTVVCCYIVLSRTFGIF